MQTKRIYRRGDPDFKEVLRARKKMRKPTPLLKRQPDPDPELEAERARETRRGKVALMRWKAGLL